MSARWHKGRGKQHLDDLWAVITKKIASCSREGLKNMVPVSDALSLTYTHSEQRYIITCHVECERTKWGTVAATWKVGEVILCLLRLLSLTTASAAAWKHTLETHWQHVLISMLALFVYLLGNDRWSFDSWGRTESTELPGSVRLLRLKPSSVLSVPVPGGRLQVQMRIRLRHNEDTADPITRTAVMWSVAHETMWCVMDHSRRPKNFSRLVITVLPTKAAATTRGAKVPVLWTAFSVCGFARVKLHFCIT